MIRFFKGIFRSLHDRNIDFDKRKFNLVMISGSASSFAGMLICIFAGIQWKGVFCTASLFLTAVFLFVLGNCTKHLALCKVMIAAGTSILIPLIWLTSGGLYSGVNIWFIYGIVFLSLLFNGKQLVYLIGFYMPLVIACYIVGFIYSDKLWMIPDTRGIMISICGSALTVGVSIFVTLRFQTNLYLEEQMINQIQQKALEDANLAQKSFFANISHEIRTPINTIIGLNEMNLRADLTPELEENCVNIQGASKMLLSLINDVLDLSKIQSQRMELVPEYYDTAGMLSELVNMVASRAEEKGLALQLDIAENLPTELYGDAVRIKQIMINILTNAIKYTHRGSVTLKVTKTDVDPHHIKLHFEVIDTGIGIKKDDIPYLFYAFRRVDLQKTKNIEGTGLGLAITGQLVDLMHGQIKVDSIYQQGSTFTIEIPQDVIDAKPIGSISKMLKHHAANTKYRQSFEAPDAQVLIVDDNRMNLLVASKLLRDTKVKIDTARSGKEGVEKANSQKYDVIFMDHMMPGMDGVETLETIRKDPMAPNAETPVIAFTANAGKDMEQFYKDHGFQGYLVKPIDGTLFEDTLMKFLPPQLVTVIESEVEPEEEIEYRINRVFKKRLVITTDTVCDLPDEYLEKYSIKCMPYYIVTENGRFREKQEIWTENLNSHLHNYSYAMSAPPEVEEYQQFFGDVLGEAEQIIHICMSKNISEGYKRAMTAAESFANVHVVDSEHVSTGIGLIVMKAADMVADNKNVDEILSAIDSFKKNVFTSFITADTNHLYRGRRINGKWRMLCNKLSLYPVLSMKHNNLRVAAVTRGSLQHAYLVYLRKCLKNIQKIDSSIIFINYADCSVRNRNLIRTEIESYNYFEKIVEQPASAAVSCNCGAGSLGIMFMVKE